MRIVIVAVGRLKSGAERELETRYLERARALGRGLALAPVDLTELSESAARRAEARIDEEAVRIAAALPAGASVIALDERGKSLASTDFAAHIGRARDSGRGTLAFVIGGPDGLAEALRARAELVVSFGALTWPHQLVRVLLAEQVYRAMTILSGHPYHRA
ncbi:23S rRNA (pseudouridine(1915)-N(3))-methyltransferase RlmH [Blastochloris viridis]|uniref:Ribosomal RNA large subunit methyltransferase H n=1 Tax=Blastochloris viridis TaxID=1079 RepID=A0A0H5B9I5_BLAVI|nr:23S rRNA (pseudouridine(1915)-N(3))-methyltransferase RlmH [Blastochloris viridis]BAR98875.1 LSU m3Psi1915 methyltransferase RlmH [Blastochloris viridis]CUU43799.1 Ribosomal RNA large subunit methyltransferase H [Blastochloris viridis]